MRDPGRTIGGELEAGMRFSCLIPPVDMSAILPAVAGVGARLGPVLPP